MGRPKKTETNEAPQFVPQVSEETAPLEVVNEEISQDTCDKVFALYASEDTPLRKGRLNVPVSIQIKGGTGALVVSTANNSIHGLLVEDGKRLEASFVVPTTFVGDDEICVTLNVQDETGILRQTQFGTRMDNLVIPKGTHIADLVIL